MHNSELTTATEHLIQGEISSEGVEARGYYCHCTS